MPSTFRFFSAEVEQDPYPFYAEARAEEPIFFCEDLGMWVAARHADVSAILRDPARFSSRLTLASVKEPPPEVVAVLRSGFPRKASILQMDPPDHTSVRRMMNAAFTPARVAAMGGVITELVNHLVDGFEADGRADLVKRFCGPLPVAVIAGILGVPRSDGDNFGRLANSGARLLMSGQLPIEEWVKAAEGFVAMQHYLAALINERKGRPAEDLLTTLIDAATEPDGQLDLAKAVSFATTFFFAGHKTTTDLISTAVYLLLKHPRELAALVSDPSLAAAAIEETLRRDCPVPGTARVATEDVLIGDVTIPKGARVLALLGSANHDEGVFQDPSRFSLDRSDTSEHIGFGRGIHFCLGAPLARLQGQVSLQVLTRRLRGLRFADDQAVKFWQVTMFRGPVSLNVAWDSA